MSESDQIMLASGAVLAVIAALATLMERRRARRVDLDRVGFMPWNAIFFVTFLGAVILLGLGGRDWLSGR